MYTGKPLSVRYVKVWFKHLKYNHGCCSMMSPITDELRREKTSLRGFRPVPTQTGLSNHSRWLDA